MKKTEQDQWKSLVDDHKTEFDSRAPKDLWKNIEGQLEQAEAKISKPVFTLWNTYKYAALFIIALGVGYLAMYMHFSSSTVNTLAHSGTEEKKEKSEESIPDYMVELAEVETYYSVEIDSRLDELKNLGDDDVISEELNLLREEFDALKAEMGDQINDERIVRAMINNYRLRLELLKEILIEIRPTPSTKKSRIYGTNAI